MKNHVNYETSVRLKEAGFPQPKPEAGQFWYLPLLGSINGENPPYCINFVGQEDIYFSRVGGIVTEREHVGNRLSVSMFLKAATFATTAADILRELGFRFYLIYDETTSQWFLNKPDSAFDIWDADNPAEAAALAWLELNEKQAENE